MSAELTASTASRPYSPRSSLSGVDAVVQETPFQCAASVWPTPAVQPPTTQTSFGDTTATDLRTLSTASLGTGTGGGASQLGCAAEAGAVAIRMPAVTAVVNIRRTIDPSCRRAAGVANH